MRLAMDAHSHTLPAQFPALLLRLLGAADAAMAGAVAALKTADVNAHAVIGQSQPERGRLLPQALAGGETKRQQQGQGGSQEARPPA